MKTIQVEDLILNTETRTVSRHGKIISLKKREYELLEFMALHRGEIFNRGTLLEYVWQYSSDMLTNTVDVHMAQLRRKIALHAKKKLIQTVFGRGYCLTPTLRGLPESC